jgi:cobalt-zinc-cadmium efflux system outer membrane protein
LVESGFNRRADLLAAQQRLAIAEGRLIQAGLRPNPVLDSEYGSPRFLGGSSEANLDVGITQLFETAGKRNKRIQVARAERDQVRAEVLALQRQLAADMRAAYAKAVGLGRQLDAFERLIAADQELVRVTQARLNEGDVAPLDLNLVRVETDRLRAQVIKTRADLEADIISLRALAGMEMIEPLQIAPLPERPPRLDLAVSELTAIALRERADLRAARLAEEAATARISLARSQATPNIAGSVRYSREKRITDLPGTLGVGPVRQTDNFLRFGVSVDIPVFNRNQGEIAAAVGERMQAQHQREFVEANIKRDVTLAYTHYRAAAEELVLYATQIIPTAQKNLQAVRSAYNAGEFSIFDVVGEQRRLIENETAYNEVLTDYYSALAELERALGTTLPPSGFAPSPITVIPNLDGIDAGRLLRSLKSSAVTTKAVDVRSELKSLTGVARDVTQPPEKKAVPPN